MRYCAPRSVAGLQARCFVATRAHTASVSTPITANRLSVAHRLQLLCDPDSMRYVSADATCTSTAPTTRGAVTCEARIFGRPVAVLAHDGNLYGGALSCADATRITSLMTRAAEEGMPLISLSHSSGAKIQEGVSALEGVSSILRHHVELSGVVPQISVIVGPCAGGAAYAAALTDLTFMVEDTSFLFVTGPAVARAVGGAPVSMAELGGADVHGSASGVAAGTFSDEVSAMAQIRRLITYLPSHAGVLPPRVTTHESRHKPVSVLSTVLPACADDAYDVHDVLEPILDRGSFFELHSAFAPNIVCGLGRLEGRTVCIIANQPAVNAGVLDLNAAIKAARLVRFADAFNIPIITFVDVPGFLPGVAQESGGILRHGAKLLYAYAEATVPRLSVILRKAYGGAYIVMNSKGLGGDRNYMWPHAEMAVMGSTAASSILGAHKAPPSEEPATLSAFIDSVLAPENTRQQLCADLDVLSGKRRQRMKRQQGLHGNIPL